MNKEALYDYILGVTDNSLILGQRLGELCGHGPSLETDIAMTNIALDLLGQCRNYYQYAAKIKGGDTTEDSIAMLRKEREYVNVLLVEQPNTHFGYVIARQFLFDVFHLLQMQELQKSKDETLASIATKNIKETLYHERFSRDWVLRLGDGTEESNAKMQEAIEDLWPYTNELFEVTKTDQEMIDAGIAVDVSKLKDSYYQRVSEILKEAKLKVPENKYFQTGGKKGIHTEHMGRLLAELQYMQRTYPNMNW